MPSWDGVFFEARLKGLQILPGGRQGLCGKVEKLFIETISKKDYKVLIIP